MKTDEVMCIELTRTSHLETGHYFNPHAQRIIEAKTDGAKLITFDPRLSNMASMSDVWLPTWPGSENTILLAIANHLIQNDLYNKDFMRKWVNWKETLQAVADGKLSVNSEQLSAEIRSALASSDLKPETWNLKLFPLFDQVLQSLYAEYTFERAAEESNVPIERIQETAKYVANCEGKLATHVWRSASVGNLGGWQVARCLLFLNVLTGSIGNKGGTEIRCWQRR